MISTPVLPVRGSLTSKDTEDLVFSIQKIYEHDELFRENGVILLDVPHLIPPKNSLTFPDKRRYTYYASGQKIQTIASKIDSREILKDFVGIHDYGKHLPDRLRKPDFELTQDLTATQMEAEFDDMINLTKRPQTLAYFNIDLIDHACRGKDAFVLPCGEPMNSLSYTPGISTPYGYYSLGKSHFGGHVEDWNLASYNVLFSGAIKLWVAVKPSSLDLLETKLREVFPKAGHCSQFMRHLAINVHPSRLREWGVEHFFVPQKAGQLVVVSGTTYHWGLNTGHNYAEAINFCLEKDWVAPKSYRECYPGCGVRGVPMSAPMLEEGTLEEKMLSANERGVAATREWEEGKRKMEVTEDEMDLGLVVRSEQPAAFERKLKQSDTKGSQSPLVIIQTNRGVTGTSRTSSCAPSQEPSSSQPTKRKRGRRFAEETSIFDPEESTIHRSRSPMPPPLSRNRSTRVAADTPVPSSSLTPLPSSVSDSPPISRLLGMSTGLAGLPEQVSSLRTEMNTIHQSLVATVQTTVSQVLSQILSQISDSQRKQEEWQAKLELLHHHQLESQLRQEEMLREILEQNTRHFVNAPPPLPPLHSSSPIHTTAQISHNQHSLARQIATALEADSSSLTSSSPPADSRSSLSSKRAESSASSVDSEEDVVEGKYAGFEFPGQGMLVLTEPLHSEDGDEMDVDLVRLEMSSCGRTRKGWGADVTRM